jgi:hypothetical protein
MKDLGPTAGQTPQAGIDELLENPAHGFLREMRKPIDLDAGPTLQMQRRVGIVENADQIQVPLERFLMMQTTDDVHFGAAILDRLAAPLEHLKVAHHVSLGIAQIAAERTKHAAIDANVRGVQMRVDVVISDIAVLPLAHQIGELADFVQIGGVAKKKLAIGSAEALAGLGFTADFIHHGHRGFIILT